MKNNFVEKRGYGKMKYVLGRGADGTAGHVELLLKTIPQAGQYLVEWEVTGNNLAVDAREKIETATSSYLQAYLTGHSEFGISVTIIEATSDDIRQNDYERAVRVAMHSALIEAGLPVPQIYASPDEDEGWQEYLAARS